MKVKFVDIRKWLMEYHLDILIVAWGLMAGAWFLLFLKLPIYAIAIGATGLLFGAVAVYGGLAKMRSLK